MPTVTDEGPSRLGDSYYRYQPASRRPVNLVVLLHGWTGDENSMWIFTRSLPEHIAFIAPRAPHPDQRGGYTWRQMPLGEINTPRISDFYGAVDHLLGFIDRWSQAENIDASTFSLLGFSQGAALSLTFALLHPSRIKALGILSGFLPVDGEHLLADRPLAGKPIYIAHGRQDAMIPVEQASRMAEILEGSGAKVTYCESDGGHSVSKECFKGMETFFKETVYPNH